MSRAAPLLGAFLLLSVVACAAPPGAVEPAAPQPTSAPPEPAATLPKPTAAALPIEALGNLTYPGIIEGPVTLSGGRFEGEPFVEGGDARAVVNLLPEPIAYGDLDGDGRTDAAVLLAANTGGSGTFIYLTAVEAGEGQPVVTVGAPLGDRVQVRALTIEDGRIVVDMITHGPDDPLCCPTLAAVRSFRQQDGRLIEEDDSGY